MTFKRKKKLILEQRVKDKQLKQQVFKINYEIIIDRKSSRRRTRGGESIFKVVLKDKNAKEPS